jgi:uncharacterized protein (DUF58 family)
MISKDILKNIRRIQIITSRMVASDFAGRYHSVFKGRGMEFHEVREYIPGDEIRSIDWNVTARTGRAHVKKFVEERELTVMIMLDASMSCRFGTCASTKNQVAAEICAVLSLSAINNNDKAGLIIFTDRVEKIITPRKGKRHVLRVIREALYYNPAGRGTDINEALKYLNRVLKRRAIVFIISDFFDKDFSKKILSVSNKRHDVVAVDIVDPREMDMADIGIARFYDMETGSGLAIDTSDKAYRDSYRKGCLQAQARNRRMFSSAGVDYIEVRTDKPYINELTGFFKTRGGKAGVI